jgi:cyclohexanecarboxyl-CoA dehydrogenase
MLDFNFTDREERYRTELRELALAELAPGYRRRDREAAYPYEEIKRVLAFGREFWAGHEEERNLIVSGITAEEVARGDFNCVLPALGPAMYEQFLGAASEEQKARWFPPLTSGEAIIGLGLTEEGAGSDMGSMQARAERRGDTYVLDGEKNSVSYLNADVFYLFARTEEGSRGWKGLSAFLVPRETPGLSFRAIDDAGCRAVPRGILTMDGVEVPVSAMVGEPGAAFPMIRRFFDINRAFIGLKCVGAAQQTIDETIEYTGGREQFGVPLSTFQGVSFSLADAATHMELGRWLCYRVLWMRKQDIYCQKESAMAKWWVPRASAEVIHKCLLLNGHKGYTRELPIEQRLRDVIGWQIGDGSEEIMKLMISRELAGATAGSR